MRTFIIDSKKAYRPRTTSPSAANEWITPHAVMLMDGHKAWAATPHALIRPAATIKLHTTR